MLKIGFVDHHLNNFHATKFLSLIRGPLAHQNAAVVSAWESHPTGDDWCVKNGVPRAGSAGEVADTVDVLMVLAPDHIEAHLDLCRAVFPAGKLCMVDKMLARDLDSARQIVELAEVHGVKLFSASGLRFNVELEAAVGARQASDAFARGMGDWDGYGVHTLSIVLGAMGSGVSKVIDTGGTGVASVTLEYFDGRRAWLDVRTAANEWDVFPWSFGLRVGDRYECRVVKDYDGFYANLVSRALDFFETGSSPVSTSEMLKVVEILETARRSRMQGGVWMDLADSP